MTDTAQTAPKRGRGRPRKVPAEQAPAAAPASPAERLRLDLCPSADTSGPRRAALTLSAARSALSFRSELAATLEQSRAELLGSALAGDL